MIIVVQLKGLIGYKENTGYIVLQTVKGLDIWDLMRVLSLF